MADSKISAFSVASYLGPTDLVPILQNASNFVVTGGTLKTYVNTPTTATVTAGVIPLLSHVGLTGVCTLPVGVYNGSRIILEGLGGGKISSVGLLPSNGFTFNQGHFVELFWSDGSWKVLVNSGMTVGIV